MKKSVERRSQRRYVSGICQLSGVRGFNPVYCNLWNISDHGALLELPAQYSFPGELNLRLIGQQAIVPVRLVWKRDGFTGVEFHDDARGQFSSYVAARSGNWTPAALPAGGETPAASADPEIARLHKENRALRRMLAELFPGADPTV